MPIIPIRLSFRRRAKSGAVKIFLKDEKKILNLQRQEEHLFEKLYLVIKDKVGTEFKPRL
jgi:hypothetical protein